MVQRRRKTSLNEKRTRWLRFIGLPGFACMVCLAALLLFIWPLITSGVVWTLRSLFNYYFGMWAALILIILLIGLASRASIPANRSEDD
jgi:phosphotransferase system  glucose/maltose/N-acetylglucosamine-specific IIC component